MTKKPLISFVAPVFNKIAWIAETIRSLQNQTLEDVEILFIDDGSDDFTRGVINHFARRDNRIRLHAIGRNVGLGKAWNIGTPLAKADIICVASGDDIWVPERAKITYDFFRKNPKKDVFYGPFWFCDPKMNKMEYKRVIPFDKKKMITPRADGRCPQYIGHFTMAYTKKIALKVPYRENLRVGVDYPFLVDLANAGAKFGWTSKDLGFARVLSTGVSQSRRAEVVAASKV